MLRIEFSELQIDRLSDIIADIGLVVFASVVLPAVLTKPLLWPAAAGLLAASVCWIISVWLLKSKEYE